MVSVDLDAIRGRARGRLNLDSIRVQLGAQRIPHAFSGNAILFPAELPPTTMARYAVYFADDAPPDLPSGDYLGKVRVKSGDKILSDQEFRLHVWDFTLPEESHVAAIYDVRFGRQGSEHWQHSFDAMHPILARFLAERRLSPDKIHPAPKIRYVDGRVEADFTAFDKAAEYYFDELGLPFAYTPWMFYLFGWGHPPKTVFGEQPFDGEPPYSDADRSQLRPEYRKAYQACLKVFWDHVK